MTDLQQRLLALMDPACRYGAGLLARQAGVHPGSVTNALKAAEKRGLVVRHDGWAWEITREGSAQLRGRTSPDNTPVIYLASPYSHDDDAIRSQRFGAACAAAAELLRRGHVVYSPIAHSHPVCAAGVLPLTWEFWRTPSLALLSRCDALWVLTLDGWRESVGVAVEVNWAKQWRMPVLYVDPVTLEASDGAA